MAPAFFLLSGENNLVIHFLEEEFYYLFMDKDNLRISWCDLTVKNADQVRDFYENVVGWKPVAVSMGEYSDWSMIHPDAGDGIAGVCNAKGVNADIPPQWLIYVTVPDLEKSIENCKALGGKVIVGPKSMGGKARFCVIQDPAGAVCALYSKGE